MEIWKQTFCRIETRIFPIKPLEMGKIDDFGCVARNFLKSTGKTGNCEKKLLFTKILAKKSQKARGLNPKIDLSLSF